MIQDVDETLRRMLMRELKKTAGCAVTELEQVTFVSPDAISDGTKEKPRVNLFFYNVQENRALRDDTFHRVTHQNDQNQIGRKRAPVRLDLFYLVTVHAGGDAATEHRLLAEVMGAFMQYDVVPHDYLAGALAEPPAKTVPMSVAQPDHTAHADPAALWQALGGKMRPVIGLKLTAPFDPFQPTWRRVVREVVLGMGLAFPPEDAQRPLSLSGVRVSVVGAVTNEQSGLPLAGVTVNLEENSICAMTDSRGYFYFLNLAPRAYTLQFQKRGMESCLATAVAPPTNRTDELEPVVVRMRPLTVSKEVGAEIARIEAQLTDTELIETERVYRVAQSGKLTYADGRPAAYIPVRVGEQRTLTDAAGVYTFFNLPQGEHPVIVEVEIRSVDYVNTPAYPVP